MKLIVISDPEYLRNEAEAIDALFEAGLEYFHLRKPGSSEEDLSELIDAVDPQWHSKIILHDHYGLQERFSLKGIHLNRRNSSSARKGIP